MIYINPVENERTTKYTQAVVNFMRKAEHATNTQILEHLQQTYPTLSATTVHRITTRMVARNELGIAPAANDNVMRFDIHTSPHDHFQCTHCDRLRDVEIPSDFFEAIQKKLGDCKIGGRIRIQGTCSKCIDNEQEVH